MDHGPLHGRLPRRRRGVTYEVELGGAAVVLTVNELADGGPGEVFAEWGKSGSTTRGLMHAMSVVLSLALQHGVPVERLVSELRNLRFEPSGRTDDPDLPEVSSVVDWMVRRIALSADAEDAAGPPADSPGILKSRFLPSRHEISGWPARRSIA